MLKDRLTPHFFMAKGTNDVILRDRLQFDIDGNGDTDLVYGRIDLSDYVSIVENKGLAIKEIRFQLRNPEFQTGGFPVNMLAAPSAPGADEVLNCSLKIFATTTAYENVVDVGIASPNVICVYTKEQTVLYNGSDDYALFNWRDDWFGTPDLHPEGYDLVTDLLIGVAAVGLTSTALLNDTVELDVMLIAEPKKITQRDLTQMLTQAQDL